MIRELTPRMDRVLREHVVSIRVPWFTVWGYQFTRREYLLISTASLLHAYVYNGVLQQYETMAFHCTPVGEVLDWGTDVAVDSYVTEIDALAGHDRMVKRLENQPLARISYNDL
jgi:hypothetical protein